MNTRKITAILASAALLGGTGISVAQAQNDSGTQTMRTAKKHKKGKKRGMSAAHVKALAAKLGVSVEKLQAALKAVRPAKPAAGERPARPNLAADLATALNVDQAKVQEILEANRPARPAAGHRFAPGTRPAKPGHTALIKALANGLNLDEATVKAAFDKLEAARKAEHDARHAAFAAALAKELGLETATVQAALEATRPAKPARR